MSAFSSTIPIQPAKPKGSNGIFFPKCCIVCEQSAQLRCSVCKNTFYCSQEHQLQDWVRHKNDHYLTESQSFAIDEFELFCETSLNFFLRLKHTGDPVKKLGLFARRNIPAGAIVLKENAIAAGRFEEIAKYFSQKASSPKEKEFWSLDYDSSLGGKIDGARDIVLKNALFNSIKDEKNKNPLCVLFLKFARFNHSCGPNAGFYYDGVKKTITVCAARDLKQGEEITVYYHPLYCLTKETRDELFKNRTGVSCYCHVCTKEDESVMDTVNEETLENVYDLFETKENFCNAFDQLDFSNETQVVSFFKNMFHFTNLLNGFNKKETTPFSTFREPIYRKTLYYLKDHPPFIKLFKENERIRSFFLQFKKESIEFFAAYSNEQIVDVLKTFLRY